MSHANHLPTFLRNLLITALLVSGSAVFLTDIAVAQAGYTDVSPGLGTGRRANQSSAGRIIALAQNGRRLYAAAPFSGLD